MQGFWPDGIYTPASDEALIFDLKFTKQLGFNMLRKHIKVESDRWYIPATLSSKYFIPRHLIRYCREIRCLCLPVQVLPRRSLGDSGLAGKGSACLIFVQF